MQGLLPVAKNSHEAASVAAAARPESTQPSFGYIPRAEDVMFDVYAPRSQLRWYLGEVD